jgi:hypothetical protein
LTSVSEKSLRASLEIAAFSRKPRDCFRATGSSPVRSLTMASYSMPRYSGFDSNARFPVLELLLDVRLCERPGRLFEEVHGEHELHQELRHPADLLLVGRRQQRPDEGPVLDRSPVDERGLAALEL